MLLGLTLRPTCYFLAFNFIIYIYFLFCVKNFAAKSTLCFTLVWNIKMSRVSAPSWAQKGQTRFFQHFTPLLSMLQKHRLALFFNNASCPLKLEATTQRDALLHPLFSSWVTVGSHVTASYVYLAVPRERKQEMLAIAGPLCTLWEIMGGVRRGGDVCPGPCSTSAHRNPIYTLSGREAAFLVIPLITMSLPLL